MTSFLLALSLSMSALSAPAAAQCQRGAYTSGKGDFVVVSTPAEGTGGKARYLFLDGRRGTD